MNLSLFHKPALAAAVSCAVLGVAGCGDGAGDYFPLEAGWRFGYRTQLVSEGAPKEVFRSTAVNLTPQTIGDVAAVPQLHQDGRILYFAGDAAGIRLIAYQKPGEDSATEVPQQFVLKYPLQAGTQWRAAGRTVLLTERFLYSKALPIKIGIDLDYTIEKVDDDLRVPAGHFFNCVKVTATGHTTVNAADNQRTLNVDVAISEWYAPGVGLVKATRAESAGEERAGNAHMVQELEYVRKPSWFE